LTELWSKNLFWAAILETATISKQSEITRILKIEVVHMARIQESWTVINFWVSGSAQKSILHNLDLFKTFCVYSVLQKKIWCTSRARVNLPHISNRKCIKFVLHRNLLKMQHSTFLSRNLNGRYLLNIKTLSFYFCSWTPK
jgi:hypothetical protein